MCSLHSGFEHRVRFLSVVRTASPVNLTSFTANYQSLWGHGHIFHGNDLGLLTVLQIMGLTTARVMQGTSPSPSDPALNVFCVDDQAIVANASGLIYIEKAPCRLEGDFTDLISILHGKLVDRDHDVVNALTVAWEDHFGPYFTLFSMLQYLGYPTLLSYMEHVFSRTQMCQVPDKTEVELEEIAQRLRRAVKRIGKPTASTLVAETPPFVPMSAQQKTRDDLGDLLRALVKKVFDLRGPGADLLIVPNIYDFWPYEYPEMPSLSSLLIQLGEPSLPGVLQRLGFHVGPDILHRYPVYVSLSPQAFPLPLEVAAKAAIRAELRDAIFETCEAQREHVLRLEPDERRQLLPEIARSLVPGAVTMSSDSPPSNLLAAGMYGVRVEWLPVYFQHTVLPRLRTSFDGTFTAETRLGDALRLFADGGDAAALDALGTVKRAGPVLVAESTLLKYFDGDIAGIF